MDFHVINELLRLAVESGASDVVTKSEKPGYLRISGRLQMVDMDPIPGDMLLEFAEAQLPASLKEAWEMEGQADFAYFIGGVGRFRVNTFLQRGSVSLVFRHIKSDIPSFEQLNLEPKALVQLAQAKDGILLVCGATGSGKSSTLACMLNWVNQNLDRHVVTLEDPIEYNFEDDKSVFNQREVGIDTASFDAGIRAVLRQNPDIILIGEMRDRTTFETALSAAETGHLVMSTLHAANVHQVLTRLFEFFPADLHSMVRRQLSNTIRGIIVQKLIPALEGGGRVPAQEILVADSVVRNLIAEGQLDKVPGMLEIGSESGSQSFNRDLYRLIKAAQISKADGLRASPNPQSLEMNLKGIFMSEGKRILG
ncbi:MAG: PilT/PilU family type 4a pilus ATPase [Puniceicoccaceae bacterium]|nr:MAG: PilT/PilU family type 4a pilus ATPase [Puniceicoccaceae bacterium]